MSMLDQLYLFLDCIFSFLLKICKSLLEDLLVYLRSHFVVFVGSYQRNIFCHHFAYQQRFHSKFLKFRFLNQDHYTPKFSRLVPLFNCPLHFVQLKISKLVPLFEQVKHVFSLLKTLMKQFIHLFTISTIFLKPLPSFFQKQFWNWM